MNVDRKIGYIINEAAGNMTEVRMVGEQSNRVVAEGVLQTGNQKNRNGRIYRTSDLAREISAPRQQELLAHGQMVGEAGHPMTSDLMRQQTIDPKCQCVRYLKFWMEGDNVMGRFKGTNNDLGEAFDRDLREGCLPAFSYRGLGTIAETPEGSIVENNKMITYDYVIYPSHPTAYTKGIVSESSLLTPKSNVESIIKESNRMDASKSFIHSFTNEDIIRSIQQESAKDYIKDKSKNYRLIKEFYDLSNAATMDIISPNKIAITESGIGTIIMNMDDYIQKEILGI